MSSFAGFNIKNISKARIMYKMKLLGLKCFIPNNRVILGIQLLVNSSQTVGSHNVDLGDDVVFGAEVNTFLKKNMR